MTEFGATATQSITGTVLRGTVFRAEPVSLGGRPHGREDTFSDHPSSKNVVQVVPQQLPRMVDVAARQAANEEAQELAHRNGYQEGWEQGLKEGLAQGREDGAAAGRHEVLTQAKDVIAAAAQEAAHDAAKRANEQVEKEASQRWSIQKAKLDALLAALPGQISQRLDAAQDDMLLLCMDAVVHVLGKTAVEPERIRDAIRQAMARLRARPLVSVELHPSDLAALQTLPAWVQWCDQHAAGLRWIASERMESGGCILTSADGSLDARLDLQLKAFRDVLIASRQELASRDISNDSAQAGGQA
jgi:flagellar assembly protein FliH